MKRSKSGLLETQICYSVQSMYYSEEYALKMLCKDLEEAAKRQCDAQDKGSKEYDQIIIKVNGIDHAFVLGGPQMEGVYMFMQQICAENGYDTPWEQPENVLTHLGALQHWNRLIEREKLNSIEDLRKFVDTVAMLEKECDDLAQECCELTDALRDTLNFYRKYPTPYDYTLEVAERGTLWRYFVKETYPRDLDWQTPKTILYLSDTVQREIKNYIHEYLVKHLDYNWTDFQDGTYERNCIRQYAEDVAYDNEPGDVHFDVAMHEDDK